MRCTRNFAGMASGSVPLLRFYEQRDLVPPDVNSSAVPTKDEEDELRQIAGAH
jgi:hypothetical protein